MMPLRWHRQSKALNADDLLGYLSRSTTTLQQKMVANDVFGLNLNIIPFG